MEQHETDVLPGSGSHRVKKAAVRRVLIQVGGLLALALVSIFLLAKIAVSPEFVSPMDEALDSQQSSAMAMAGSASALSIVLAAVPTDATTPVANQLANLSSFFVISIAAVILQKALITVVGYVAFTYLIPLACGLGITYLVFRWESVRIIAVKLALFGLTIVAVIPASIAVGAGITDSYGRSVEETLAAADTAAEKAEALTVPKEDRSEASGNVFEQAEEALDGAVQSVTGAINGGLNAVEDVKNEAVASLNSFVERTALLIVTTCIIPVLTVLTFAWLIKLFFSFDTRVGSSGRWLQLRMARGITAAGRSVGSGIWTGSTSGERREN